MNSVHGGIGCIGCHDGTAGAAEKAAAHEGMVADPSETPETSCAGMGCHDATVSATGPSIHRNLSGYRELIALRTGTTLDANAALMEGFESECNKCHTSCGQCHISRPNSVGGGFIASHKFDKSPSMINQCTACHGSRVGDEYRGKIDGARYDVHYAKNSSVGPGNKHCVNCHTADEMHAGSGDHRYQVAEMPRCEDCHSNVAGANSYHSVHWDDLSCHVCHSQDYRNCDACHSPHGLDEESYVHFKIGKNTIPGERSYQYVTLRHIPVVPDTYAGWGYAGGMPNYDAAPTWKYASPHNIQRWTARTDTTGGQSCSNACHNSPATTEGFFLRQVDLAPGEEAANAPYIVPDTPVGQW